MLAFGSGRLAMCCLTERQIKPTVWLIKMIAMSSRVVKSLKLSSISFTVVSATPALHS